MYIIPIYFYHTIMTEWTFMDFLDGRGTNPIRDWLKDVRQVPLKAKAKIDRIQLGSVLLLGHYRCYLTGDSIL